MLCRQSRTLLAQATPTFGMDAVQRRGIETDGSQSHEPLEDDAERLSTGLASRLAHPTQAAQVRAIARKQQGVEPAALIDAQRPCQQVRDVAFRIEKSLGHHAFDLADAGNNDATTAELVEQQPCQLGTAGGRQRHRQQPLLQRGANRVGQHGEAEHLA